MVTYYYRLYRNHSYGKLNNYAFQIPLFSHLKTLKLKKIRNEDFRQISSLILIIYFLNSRE